MLKFLRVVIPAIALVFIRAHLTPAQAPPSADTFVSSTQPGGNNGASTTLRVSSASTTFIKFDLSSVPTSTTLRKATLRLYVNEVAESGSFDVREVTGVWGEDTLVFNTPPPPLGSSATGTHPIAVSSSSVNSFIVVDVTPLVQGWVNGTIANNGLALALISGTGNFSFDSKENLQTSHAPEIDIITAPVPSARQIATFRWFEASQSGGAIPVPNRPTALAFDGSNMWVASEQDGSIRELRGGDGSVISTFSTTFTPQILGHPSLLFDGTNIWLSSDTGFVKSVNARSGIVRCEFQASAPLALSFDGTNVWVASSDHVTAIRASNCTLVRTIFVEGVNQGLAFDGVNIWVTNLISSSRLVKVRASDGAVLGSFRTGGNGADRVAFDGANLWVTNQLSDTVTKVRASDGTLLGTFPVGSHPGSLVFDGVSVWVANQAAGTVTKLRAVDGSLVGTFAAGPYPTGLAFDGLNVWVARPDNNIVTKF